MTKGKKKKNREASIILLWEEEKIPLKEQGWPNWVCMPFHFVDGWKLCIAKGRGYITSKF